MPINLSIFNWKNALVTVLSLKGEEGGGAYVFLVLVPAYLSEPARGHVFARRHEL